MDSSNHPLCVRVRIQNRSILQGLFRSHRTCQTTLVCCGCSTCVSSAKKQCSRFPVLIAIWGAFNSNIPHKLAAAYIGWGWHSWHFLQSHFSDRGSHCRCSEGYSLPCDSDAREMDQQCLPTTRSRSDLFDIFGYAFLSQASWGAVPVQGRSARFHGVSTTAPPVLRHRFGLMVDCGRVTTSATSLHVGMRVQHDSLRHLTPSSSCR